MAISITTEIEEINRITQERTKLKKQYSNFLKQINELKATVQTKREEYAKAKQLNDKQTMQRLYVEANEINKELSNLSVQLKQLEEKGKSLLPILLGKLNITLKELSNEITLLKEVINKLKQEKKSLEILIQTKREEYAKAKQLNDKQTMQRLYVEANEIKERLSSILSEINTHNETIQKNQELIDIFKKELDVINKPNSKKEVKNQSLNTKSQYAKPQQNSNINIVKKNISYSGIFLKIEDIQEVETEVNGNKLQTIKLIGIGDDGVKSEVLVKLIDNSKKKKYLNCTLEDWKRMMYQKALNDAKNAKTENYKKEVEEFEKEIEEKIEEKSNELYIKLDENNKELEEKVDEYLQLEEIQKLPKRKQEPAVVDKIAEEIVLRELNITLKEGQTFEDYIEEQKANAKEKYLQDGHIIDIGSVIRIGTELVDISKDKYNNVIERKFVSELNEEKIIKYSINRIMNNGNINGENNEVERILLETRRFITKNGVDSTNTYFDTTLNSFNKFEEFVKHSIRTFASYPGITLGFYNFKLKDMSKIPLKDRTVYQELNELIQFFSLPKEDIKEIDQKLVINKYNQILNIFKNNPKIYKETKISVPLARYKVDFTDLRKDIANKIKNYSEISMGIKNIKPILEGILQSEGIFEKQEDLDKFLDDVITMTITEEISKYVKENKISEGFLIKYNTPKQQIENKTSIGFMGDNTSSVPYYKIKETDLIVNQGIKPKFVTPKEITYNGIEDLLNNPDIGEGIKKIIETVNIHIQKNQEPSVAGIGE